MRPRQASSRPYHGSTMYADRYNADADNTDIDNIVIDDAGTDIIGADIIDANNIKTNHRNMNKNDININHASGDVARQAAQDDIYMQQALRLARRALGQVFPNPAVGCVLVRDNVIVGCGHTQKGGRPHAETMALDMAGGLAQGSCAYITLEPCAHHGQTGPCAQALIAAGIKRVVIAMKDPDPQVNGYGLALLREAGIIVDMDVCRQAALRLNRGYVCHRVFGRPSVLLKIAVSANGMMRVTADNENDNDHNKNGHNKNDNDRTENDKDASNENKNNNHKNAGNNKSRTITGRAARRYMHLLRAECDAILIGARTFLTDRPQLTCRLSGMTAYSPSRYIASRKSLAAPAGFTVLHGATPAALLQELAAAGITRLMVEGGVQLARAFLQDNLVDEIALFTASGSLDLLPPPAPSHQGTAKSAPQSDLHYMGLDKLSQNPDFEHIREENWPSDKFDLFIRQDTEKMLYERLGRT